MIGGAIGDALGAPIEFASIDHIKATYGESGITDFVEFQGNRGAFTDDTQMTLFTAEALYQRRAPGNTCLNALRSDVSGTMHGP